MIKHYLILLCFFALAACKQNKVTKTYCADEPVIKYKGLNRELNTVLTKMKDSTGIRVLETGTQAMLTRAWLCNQAEKSIDIQYFIFAADNLGLIACDYLVRAADRGVQVYILVDDIVVDAELSDLESLASHQNIHIKIYNPGVNLGKNLFQKLYKFSTDYRSANQRMHNKTFIVDDKIAITGGRNIADEYFDYDHQYNFRDRDLLLIGKDVRQIKKSFHTFWNYELSIPVQKLKNHTLSNKYDFTKLHEYTCNTENFWPQVKKSLNEYSLFEAPRPITWLKSIQFVSDAPGKNDGSRGLYGGGITTDSLVALVKKAKKSIYIQTPYLITTAMSRQLLKNVVDKGVNIKILTNGMASTDALEAFSAYQTDRYKVLETGVEIYEYKPNANIQKKLMTGELHKNQEHQPTFGLHAKTMIIDDEITVVGSFNFDPRSANLNTECITILRSTILTEEVLKAIKTDFLPENSWKITPDFNPDHLVNKTKQLKVWTRKIIPKNIL
ncbi:phospholipase D-like domain-containing protein [Wenyingzhuangia sp. IMCC45533]